MSLNTDGDLALLVLPFLFADGVLWVSWLASASLAAPDSGVEIWDGDRLEPISIGLLVPQPLVVCKMCLCFWLLADAPFVLPLFLILASFFPLSCLPFSFFSGLCISPWYLPVALSSLLSRHHFPLVPFLDC